MTFCRILARVTASAALMVTSVHAAGFIVTWESNWVLKTTGILPGSTCTVETASSLDQPFEDSLFDFSVADESGCAYNYVPVPLQNEPSMFFRVRSESQMLQENMAKCTLSPRVLYL